MTGPELRLVYDAEAAAPPRPEPACLASVEEILPRLRELLQDRSDGEVVVRGYSSARISLFDGTIAWVRVDDYPEHLGHVVQRELGVTAEALRRGIGHCRSTGQRLGEGLVALGLVSPKELRECLKQHVCDQLLELFEWPGEVTFEHHGWPHRYDRRFTFELDELLERPTLPTADEKRWLESVTAACHERRSDLYVAFVIEREEGTVLTSNRGEDPVMEDVLGLCLAGLQRLGCNRLTGRDGPPCGMVLAAAGLGVVVRPIRGRPDWMLVVAGPCSVGRLLTLARAALTAAGPFEWSPRARRVGYGPGQ